MKRTLLYNSICSAILLITLGAAGVSAQTDPSSPTTKRNSPFAPNPKKKSETKTEPAAGSGRVDELSAAQIVKVRSDNSTAQNTDSPIEANFESRSVAAKTLEIAKKAGSAMPVLTEVYKVGTGDILFISLLNAPGKDSTYFTVLADGSIDYPLAGEIVRVAGLTTEQIEDFLREKIRLYENPQVSVKIREYNSHIYTAVGLVENSGERRMQREAIPLYVVKAEAMVQPRANRVTIKRPEGGTETLYLKDASTNDVLIYPGDVLDFGSDEQSESGGVAQFYFIGGEILSGGRKPFTSGLTLTQAILESGGLKKNGHRKVVIRRKNADGLLIATQFDLKAIKDGKVPDPVLTAGDTIEIDN